MPQRDERPSCKANIYIALPFEVPTQRPSIKYVTLEGEGPEKV